MSLIFNNLNNDITFTLGLSQNFPQLRATIPYTEIATADSDTYTEISTDDSDTYTEISTSDSDTWVEVETQK